LGAHLRDCRFTAYFEQKATNGFFFAQLLTLLLF